MKVKIFLIGLFGIGSAAGLVTGCATNNSNKTPMAATFFNKESYVIARGGVQSDAALASLDELVTHPQADLRDQYNAFAAAVSTLESTTMEIAGEKIALKKQAGGYFNEWDRENAAVQETTRSNLNVARRDEVAVRFARIIQDYDEIGKAFRPYMSDLRDAQKVLANDLTGNGLSSIKDSAAQATADAVLVKASLDRLSADFDDSGSALER